MSPTRSLTSPGRSTRGARAALLLGLGAAALLGVRAGEDPPRVVLAAAGETLGHLEPCRCVSGMLGGLPRRLEALRRLRAEGGDVVHADLGDLTSPKQHHPGILEAKTRAALDLLSRGQVAAVAVGELDLRLGVEPLRRLARAARVTLLGANLLEAGPDGPRPAFAVRRDLTLPGGGQVALVGLLDPDLADPTGSLETGDPVAAARAAFAGAPEGALRVVLFHGAREGALAALDAGLPADVVVCGHRQERRREPLERAGALVVETVRDARLLTRVTLAGAGRTADHVVLDGHVPDEPGARERIDAYYAEVRGLPEEPRRPVPEGGAFVGSETCRGCHAEAWDVFVETPHHRAQERIVAADPRASLSECTACHVTGFGYASGFEGLRETPHLAEVGCESCHGVGEAHAMAGPTEKRGYGVREGFPESWRPVCTRCHDPSNSPDFDFEEALEQIRHWEER